MRSIATKKIKDILKNPFVFFPFITLIVFWPISLGLYSFKNDILTYYYPIRTLISDSLTSGHLPLWTPYINMGYPIHGDLQSCAWNPIVWLFSILTGYTLYGFHLDVLFHFCLAGLGFYYLSRDLGLNRMGALTLGLAYELSGPLIDSVQFYTILTSAAYLPFIFLFFRRSLRRELLLDKLLAGLFIFFLFTGGYPSISIGTFYFLIAYFLFYLFTQKIDAIRVKKLLLTVLIISFVFLSLSLPAILSFSEMIKHISRGNVQKLAFVFQNSSTVFSLFSFLSPFSTTADSPLLNTDLLVRSFYIGIPPFILLIAGLFSKKIKYSAETKFFLSAAIIFLLFTLGKLFIVRELSYYILPFMKYFRHPGTYRLFVTFSLLIVIAYHINYLKIDRFITYTYKLVGIALLLLTIMVFILTSASDNLNTFTHLLTSFSSFSLKEISFSQRLLIQLPFIFLSILSTIYLFNKQKTFKHILLLSVIELVLFTQFNIPVTVIGSKPKSVLETYVSGPAVAFPSIKLVSINDASKNSYDTTKTIGTRLIYTKQIGRNKYFITPANLIAQNKFYTSKIRPLIFNYPVIYIADTIVKIGYEADSMISKKIAVLDSANIKLTPSGASPSNISLGANSFSFNIVSQVETLVVLQQNIYPGWRVYVNGVPSKLLKVNIAFMGVHVNKGSHSIEFRYEPNFIKESWLFSVIILCSIICFWVFLFFKYPYIRNSKRERHPF